MYDLQSIVLLVFIFRDWSVSTRKKHKYWSVILTEKHILSSEPIGVLAVGEGGGEGEEVDDDDNNGGGLSISKKQSMIPSKMTLEEVNLDTWFCYESLLQLVAINNGRFQNSGFYSDSHK